MTNELTVRVERPVIPAMNWNKDEVQKNLDELLASYTGRVYTPESIKDAKADRAAVNKWDKQLAAALTAAKRLYTDPLEDFQKSIREMQAQCKKISGAIDQQVKAVEQAQREEKASTLRLVYRDCVGELEPLISFDRLLVPQWLNKTFDLAQAEKELRKAVETRREELRLIRETCGEDAEPCITEYLRALSVNDALHEHSRREHARAAQAEAEVQRKAGRRTCPRSCTGDHPSHRGRASAERRGCTGGPEQCLCDSFRAAGLRGIAAVRPAWHRPCTCPQTLPLLGRFHPGRHRMVQSRS